MLEFIVRSTRSRCVQLTVKIWQFYTGTQTLAYLNFYVWLEGILRSEMNSVRLFS